MNYDEEFDFGGSSYWEFKNDDLWTPKPIVPSYVPDKLMSKRSFISFFQSKFSDTVDVKSENLDLYVQDINISLEVEELDSEDIPMIILKSSLKIQIKDWSDQFQLNGVYFKILTLCILFCFTFILILGDLNLSASYYNYNLSVWEPFIEPWSITLKVYHIIFCFLFIMRKYF